ncbi:hypothetical protein D3C80_1734860 [compost metagenome]
MTLARLHVDVRVTDDVLVAHEHRALGAIGVLAAAIPHRLAVQRQQHTLVHIERPTVIARQPRHVRRVGNQQQLDALRLHRGAGLGQALRILLPTERQIDDDLRHANTLVG